ncbi:eukaryotic translation initiation factor 2C, partial [Phenoliferia sp. Uapishka_3]
MDRPLNSDGSPVIGTLGANIKVQLNTFRVELQVNGRLMTADDTVAFFQYNVNILAIKRSWKPRLKAIESAGDDSNGKGDNSNKSAGDEGTDTEKDKEPQELDTAPSPKRKLRNIWRELEATGVFGDVKPVYDGRNIAYSAKPLDLSSLSSYRLHTKNDGDFIIAINDEVRLNPSELITYFTGSGNYHVGDVYAVLAMLNTLFSHGPANAGLPSNKTKFFLKYPKEYGLSNGHEPFALPRGIELLRGLSQSELFLLPSSSASLTLDYVIRAVRPAPDSLFLNIDTTTGAFIQTGNLVDFIARFISGRNKSQAPGERDRIHISRLIRNSEVTVDRGKSLPLKIYKVGVGLTSDDARSHTFSKDDTRITIEEYYKKHYSINLKYPHMPCVKIREGLVFPIEFVSIKEGNRYLKKLDSEQQLRASEFQTLRFASTLEFEEPTDRLKAISAIGASDTLSRPYLPEFGVVASKAPMEITARKLEPPVIDYGLSKQKVQEGHWSMQRGVTKLAVETTINSYAVIVTKNERDSLSTIMKSMDDILRGCSELGTQNVRFTLFAKRLIYLMPGASVATIAATAVKLTFERPSQYGSKPDIIFEIFNVQNDPEYHYLKAFGLRNGIATQALQLKNVQPKKASNFQFIINLALKMGPKLHGINHGLAKGTTSGDQKAGYLEKNPAFILGGDLSHLDKKPSIASVVCSMDRKAIHYGDAITVQRLIEPTTPGASLLSAKPSGRPKRQEIIEHLSDMVFDLLTLFFEVNKYMPASSIPNSIIFFRDGVSESEWDAVMAQGGSSHHVHYLNLSQLTSITFTEVPAIKDGVKRLKATPALAEKLADFDPKLTFILAVKNHHIRAFPTVDRKSSEGKSGNIPAGTVIDTGVADPRVFDFYLIPHTGILGTTRPTRIVKLTDEQQPRMTPDDIQGLTNSLCHVYQRCNRAVSLPAPVYYADIIAGKMRAMMPDTDRDGTATATSDSNGSPHSRESDLALFNNFLADIKNGHAKYHGKGVDALTLSLHLIPKATEPTAARPLTVEPNSTSVLLLDGPSIGHRPEWWHRKRRDALLVVGTTPDVVDGTDASSARVSIKGEEDCSRVAGWRLAKARTKVRKLAAVEVDGNGTAASAADLKTSWLIFQWRDTKGALHAIPEKASLVLSLFNRRLNHATPPSPRLRINFCSAATFLTAFPFLVAKGFGIPKMMGLKGVNQRVLEGLVRIGREEPGDLGLVLLIDYFEEREGLAELLIAWNFY